MSLRADYNKVKSNEIDKWDHYIDIYAQRLPKRGHPVNILEIGVQGGGSLKLWRRYFGSSARIVGIDVDECCASIKIDGATVVLGSQGDVAFLDRIIAEYGPFDVVIDDGSHRGCDQITSFKRLIHHTKCIYFVEDTHTSYWGKWQPPSESFIHFAKGLIDDLHMYFIVANSPEVYGAEAWSDIVGERNMGARSYLRSITFYDSMIAFEVGNPLPPLRRSKGTSPNPQSLKPWLPT